MGNVALWKYSPPLTGKVVDGEMKWKLQAPATVEGPIKQIRVRLDIMIVIMKQSSEIFMYIEHCLIEKTGMQQENMTQVFK